MRLFTLAAALFACMTFSALADDEPVCRPLDDIKIHALSQGLEEEAIVVVYDADHPGFVESYHAALGWSIPSESEPIGMLFLLGGSVVLLALIEPEDCVRFHAKIQSAIHGAVWRRVNDGA